MPACERPPVHSSTPTHKSSSTRKPSLGTGLFMGPSWMAECAAEELRTLEAEHPNGLGRLKLELKAFISDALNSSRFPAPRGASPPPFPPLPPACSAATQESSNRKRKKDTQTRDVAAVTETWRGRKLWGRGAEAAKDSVDMALERAEECLRKIRRAKEVLANSV